MPKYRVSITEQIMATLEVVVEAADEDAAIEAGREKAFATHLGQWQQDMEIVNEEAEEIEP
jgi:hypothetical protein